MRFLVGLWWCVVTKRGPARTGPGPSALTKVLGQNSVSFMTILSLRFFFPLKWPLVPTFLSFSSWPLAFGFCFLAFSFWLLAFGFCLWPVKSSINTEVSVLTKGTGNQKYSLLLYFLSLPKFWAIFKIVLNLFFHQHWKRRNRVSLEVDCRESVCCCGGNSTLGQWFLHATVIR